MLYFMVTNYSEIHPNVAAKVSKLRTMYEVWCMKMLDDTTLSESLGVITVWVMLKVNASILSA